MPGVSPGVVKDDEILLRELFNPEHVKDGKLTKRAIAVKDLRERGYSVHRMTFVSESFVRASIQERLGVPRRNGVRWKDEGVARLVTSGVRSLHLDGERAFVVIDTALGKNRGHASIFARKPEKGEAYVRKLRSLLLPFLENRVSVAVAYRDSGMG